jgi:hypothetical protein
MTTKLQHDIHLAKKSNQQINRKLWKKIQRKRASYSYRTATTAYPCFRQDLGDSAGAGRTRLARLQM